MSIVYQCQLSTEDKKYAEEELHETEEIRKIRFEEIHAWAAENPQFNVKQDEKYILPFLRGCKFDLEKTKQKMQNFYTMRKDRTEWFQDRNPELTVVQELVRLGSFLVLRETHEKQLIVIIRPAYHDPNKYSMNDVLKSAFMVLDIALMEEEIVQIYGVTAIVDLMNMSLAHARQFSFTQIRNLVYAWQNYYCRLKKMEFVNCPTHVNVVLNVFRSFMSEKMKKRIYLSSDQNSLATNIDESILPSDYGGSGEDMDHLGEYWVEKLLSYKDWFVEDENYKAY